MKIEFSISLPESFTQSTDVRGNFRRAQSREVRPVFDALLGSVQGQTPYDSIRSGFSVDEQETATGVEFALRNSVPYWIFREDDTVPHWAPWGPGTPLAQWAEAHGIPAFLVARKIAREGTKGNHVVREAWQAYKPQVQDAEARGFYAWARAWGGPE